MKKLLALIALSVCASFAQSSLVVQNPQGIYPDGQSHAVVQSYISLINQSASITTANLTCVPTNFNGAANQNIAATIGAPVGQQCPAGLYRISAYANTNTAGSGNVTFTFGYTSAGTARAAAGNVLGTLAIAGTNEDPAAAANGTRMFRHDGSSQITFLSTYSATGTYDVFVVLERLQ